MPVGQCAISHRYYITGETSPVGIDTDSSRACRNEAKGQGEIIHDHLIRKRNRIRIRV